MANVTAADVAKDMVDKFEAKIAERSEADKAELRDEFKRTIDQAVESGVMAALAGRKYTPGGGEVDPESDAALKGTVYGRLGLDMAQAELAHDILASARAIDHRVAGPSEKLSNIVQAARKQRAMDTAESGYGAQLVADAVYVPKLWDAARMDHGAIMGMIETRPMAGPIEKHPVLGNVPTMIWVGESTAAISGLSEYGTQKVASNEVTLTAQKFLAHYNFSGELVEDSVVPLIPLFERAFAETQAYTADCWVLNGDDTNAATGNINLDDADPADTLYYLAGDGARHAFIVDNTANGVDAAGILTYRKITNLPTLMIDRTRNTHWGRANEVVYICNPELEDDILNLDELKTVANAGQAAGVLTGEIARIGRFPLISSIAMPLTEADGKCSTTAGNNTKGTILCLNPRGLLWGVKRQAQIETERRPGTDQWRLTLSTRVALGRYTPTGAASGIEWAAGLYDI